MQIVAQLLENKAEKQTLNFFCTYGCEEYHLLRVEDYFFCNIKTEWDEEPRKTRFIIKTSL